jgi:hypothetical protein
VRVGARGNKATVGQHHIGRHQIVEREAETPGEVTDPAAEGQAADAGSGHKARRQRHSERSGGMINVAPDTTTVDPDRTGHRVNRCAPQPAEVDDEGVVPDRETATVVTPPRMASGSTWSRAYATQAITSATSAHCTIASG